MSPRGAPGETRPLLLGLGLYSPTEAAALTHIPHSESAAGFPVIISASGTIRRSGIANSKSSTSNSSASASSIWCTPGR